MPGPAAWPTPPATPCDRRRVRHAHAQPGRLLGRRLVQLPAALRQDRGRAARPARLTRRSDRPGGDPPGGRRDPHRRQAARAARAAAAPPAGRAERRRRRRGRSPASPTPATSSWATSGSTTAPTRSATTTSSTRRYFPDLHFDVIEVHHGDDAVVCEMWMSGTHLGSGPEFEATGRRFRCRTAIIFAFEGDRLVGARVVLRHGHDRPPARLSTARPGAGESRRYSNTGRKGTPERPSAAAGTASTWWTERAPGLEVERPSRPCTGATPGRGPRRPPRPPRPSCPRGSPPTAAASARSARAGVSTCRTSNPARLHQRHDPRRPRAARRRGRRSGG